MRRGFLRLTVSQDEWLTIPAFPKPQPVRSPVHDSLLPRPTKGHPIAFLVTVIASFVISITQENLPFAVFGVGLALLAFIYYFHLFFPFFDPKACYFVADKNGRLRSIPYQAAFYWHAPGPDGSPFLLSRRTKCVHTVVVNGMVEVHRYRVSFPPEGPTNPDGVSLVSLGQAQCFYDWVTSNEIPWTDLTSPDARREYRHSINTTSVYRGRSQRFILEAISTSAR